MTLLKTLKLRTFCFVCVKEYIIHLLMLKYKVVSPLIFTCIKLAVYVLYKVSCLASINKPFPHYYIAVTARRRHCVTQR